MLMTIGISILSATSATLSVPELWSGDVIQTSAPKAWQVFRILSSSVAIIKREICFAANAPSKTL
jgi:hypothetical protein